MKYNVLTDFHHSGLLNSLRLLFEVRLGGNLYRQIGREWYERGYWKVFDHPATVAQYLDIGGATPDNTRPLNVVKSEERKENVLIYHCQDIDSGLTNKAITFDGFMQTKIDIVIASIPAHIEPFRKLCQEHPNKPKLVFQIGNDWTIEAGLAPNVMASAKINDIPDNINFISYHQEFDLDIFRYGKPNHSKKIFSFVNCFNTASHYVSDWQLFKRIEETMSSWIFRAFGGQCRDGSKNGDKEVASAMHDCQFIWNTKAGGDGFGHIVFNSAAVGRPMITKKEYYHGKLGEKLMIDGETCITIDNLSLDEIINKIRYYGNNDQRYYKMCEATHANFKKTVDYDNEEQELCKFFQHLQ